MTTTFPTIADLVAEGLLDLDTIEVPATPKPPPPLPKWLPKAVVYMITTFHCAHCGEAYTAPTYADNSCFLRQVKAKARGTRYIPYNGGHPHLPRSIQEAKATVTSCPQCFMHPRGISPKEVPLIGSYSALQRATRVHTYHQPQELTS